MGNSHVPEIKLRDDGSIDLTVKVSGFEAVPAATGAGTADTRVEVSGEVTQPSGGIATFYDIQNLPAAEPDGSYILAVSATPLQKFAAEDEAITAVSRAARIWGTMLHRDSGDPPPEIKAVWKA